MTATTEKESCGLPFDHLTVDDPEERNAMGNLITLCRGGCHSTWEEMAPLRPDTATPRAD